MKENNTEELIKRSDVIDLLATSKETPEDILNDRYVMIGKIRKLPTYEKQHSNENTANAYTYRAKEINWKTSAKDDEKQYVTGNIVTVGDRYFIVNPEIVNDFGFTGLSFDNGFTEIDKDTIEPVIEPVIDEKKRILTKVLTELTYLTDATTDEELAALCEACNYNYDILSAWNKESKIQAQGSIISSDFARALAESYYDENALIEYAKKYKEFMNESPTKTNNIKPKVSDREL